MFVFAALVAASLHGFTPQGWTSLRSASALAVSRDGHRILYEVSHGVDKGSSAHEWWIVGSDGRSAEKLSLPKDFKPEGFIRDGGLYGRYPQKDGPPQIATFDANRLLVTSRLVQGVGEVAISPDGRRMAMLSSNEPKDPLADVRTVIQNPISTPYVVNVDGTGGAWWCPSVTDAQDIAWSPDGKALAVLTQVPKIGHHQVTGAIDVCRPNHVMRVAAVPNAVASIAWTNGGSTLAFLSTSTPTLTPEHVYTVPAAGGSIVDRTPDLAGTATALTGDARGNVWVLVMRGVQGEIDRFAGGTLVPAYRYAGGTLVNVRCSPFAGASGQLAFTVSDPTHAGNVAVAAGNVLRRVTREGDAQLEHTALGEVRVVHWQGPQTPLTGIVTLPPGYVAGRHYPFINMPHGGPEGNDVLGFNPDAQLLAARGYVVMQTEYRGSTGVNAAFTAMIYQHFGDRAYADVDSATDYAIAQGWADPKHLGIWGWSAGGFMTAWTVTQTHRYRAAVEGAGITDWLSFVPTSDLSQIDYDARSHITDPQAFLQFSPIMFADRVTTPLLILDGEADVRVPLFQGREYFIFLRELGKTARMVTYPGSPHFPDLWEQRRNVFDETFRWFDRYL
jgi:dipeptidyl aminopeptidase/acylaminoacyl peptidase